MADSAPSRNGPRTLELKIRGDEAELARVGARLRAAGAATVRLRQIDTYFAAPRGRLKLREIAGPDKGARAAEVIAYARLDVAGARWSAYDRAPIPPEDVPALKRALASAIGIRAVVAKAREIGLLRRTRVHLDRVEGLGCFVELETVVAPGEDEAGAAAELAEIAALLGLDRLEPVAGSYVDLVPIREGRTGTRR